MISSPGVAGAMARKIVVVICVFVLYAVLFSSLLSPGDPGLALVGAVAATVVTVYLYVRIAKRVGLE
jgi:hypothetical protein